MSFYHFSRKVSPALFAITMGTGAISILFYTFPYGRGTQTMMILSLVVFFLNLFLFLLFTVISLARYIMFPETWSALLSNPILSLYTGCFPMAGTTLINVAVDVIYVHFQFGGRGFLYFIWATWWLDVAVSMLCCWGVVHLMATKQEHSLKAMTSAWLLPVITLTVAASSGGVLARALYPISPLYALISVSFAVFLISVGLTLAFMILTVYVLRLIVYGLPPGATILSAFLPLGPMAQSGFGMLLVGQNFRTILPYASNSVFLNSDAAGDTINAIGTSISFYLWSVSTMWIIFALLGIGEISRKFRITYRISYWGLIFPNGVYANLSIQLAQALDSRFFRVYGAVYAILTLLLWLYVAFNSLFSLRRYLTVKAEPALGVIEAEVKSLRDLSATSSSTAA